jgi:hypothetical protein
MRGAVLASNPFHVVWVSTVFSLENYEMKSTCLTLVRCVEYVFVE